MSRDEYEKALASLNGKWRAGEIDKREAHHRSLDLFNQFWRIYQAPPVEADMDEDVES